MTKAQGSSSGTAKHDEPINFSKEFSIGAPVFIEEPDIKEAEDKIWKSQVIISCPNSQHALLGPLPIEKETPKGLSTVFPCSEEQLPLVFTKGPYDLSFLKSKFRTEPRIGENDPYISWLDKLEKKKGQFWKDIGIFDLIQLSRLGPKYHNELIIAALHFWNPSTNSLHLKCGMFTPTGLMPQALLASNPLAKLSILISINQNSHSTLPGPLMVTSS